MRHYNAREWDVNSFESFTATTCELSKCLFWVKSAESWSKLQLDLIQLQTAMYNCFVK